MLFANRVATILALDPANVRKLVTAIAAYIVVAYPIIHVHEWYVCSNVACIGTPEAREGIGCVGGARDRPRKGLLGRKCVDVRTGSRAWLVRAIGAIAGVVIDLGRIEGNRGVADTCEGRFARVEFDDCSGVNS